jgi:hypothetical protein
MDVTLTAWTSLSSSIHSIAAAVATTCRVVITLHSILATASSGASQLQFIFANYNSFD